MKWDFYIWYWSTRLGVVLSYEGGDTRWHYVPTFTYFLMNWDICIWQRLTCLTVIRRCECGIHTTTLQCPTLNRFWLKWDMHIWKRSIWYLWWSSRVVMVGRTWWHFSILHLVFFNLDLIFWIWNEAGRTYIEAVNMSGGCSYLRIYFFKKNNDENSMIIYNE